MNFIKYVAALGLTLALAACGGGGGSAGTPLPGTGGSTGGTTTPATANSTVASIMVNSSSDSLNADGTSKVTLTVYALTSGSASVAGATIDLAATNGVILSAPSVVTTATGVTVTITAVSSDQTNRVATVTASCAGCTANPATTQINVVGASIALTNSGSTSLVVGGATSTLSATVKSFSGAPLSGVDVSFAATDPLVLGLNVASAKTNNAGVAQVTVTGLAAGSAIVNVSALGNAKSQAYTSGAPAAVLAVTSPSNNSVLITNVPQTITVSAPVGATSVIFATTLGTFTNGQTSQNTPVDAGIATAILTAAQAGTATVTVIDSLSNSVNLTLVVSPPVSSANKILLNASQTTLPISVVDGSQYSLTLTARAIAYDGSKDQAVANVPILFSMTGGPGAGEYLTPAIAYTNSSGIAVATFTSGSVASISNGIKVSATIQGTAFNNNVLLTVGGEALSVGFGPSSVLGESADKTLYIQAYSVQVTDANNNPVSDQVVTLRMRPVAFSTGSSCTIVNTYCSEDVNGNGSLDVGEDGTRTLLSSAAEAASCPAVAPVVTGTLDGNLTPPNSDGGGIPATVTTDANGIAGFNLTYLKGSAIWVVNKLTAIVSSNGTETSKSTIFRLAPSVPDVGPPCHLPASPYSD
ncbi:MAG: hypothetical protein CVU24_14880 [Betaproteobacteria bacterium HGW-Betaproteobacteria-18]|nr:MAG: hypothetical protein CVU24_14880 [Betaproteobacteria bacterium HGW-Betaproteobacteria-18]